MILLAEGKWEVRDTITGELWSEHPFTTDYEKQQAKTAALEENERWKASLGN